MPISPHSKASREPTIGQCLNFDEHRLVSIVAGAVFRDDLGALCMVREKLDFFPEDARLVKMAQLWSAVAAELPFVGRAGHVGDDLGSHILCARLAERAMRLCFLIDRKHAPYAKWLGTAWSRLPSAASVKPHLSTALAAACWRERQRAISLAFEDIARQQMERAIPGATPPVVKDYFDRPYVVVNADEIAAGLGSAISDPALRPPSEPH